MIIFVESWNVKHKLGRTPTDWYGPSSGLRLFISRFIILLKAVNMTLIQGHTINKGDDANALLFVCELHTLAIQASDAIASLLCLWISFMHEVHKFGFKKCPLNKAQSVSPVKQIWSMVVQSVNTFLPCTVWSSTILYDTAHDAPILHDAPIS